MNCFKVITAGFSGMPSQNVCYKYGLLFYGLSRPEQWFPTLSLGGIDQEHWGKIGKIRQYQRHPVENVMNNTLQHSTPSDGKD